jgi:hypothetical protein
MSLLVQHQIFKQDTFKINNFLKTKLKENNKHRENAIDTFDDQYEFYKTYYLGKNNTQNNFIDKDLLSELISQENLYNKNIQIKKTSNFLELLLKNEDFDIDIDYNNKQEAFLFFYNNDDKTLREIFIDIDLDQNEFNFKKINEKKIKTNFEVQNMKLINSNYIENRNFLIFNDLYNIYKLNVKAIHDNLQENTDKITTIEEIPICFISDLYMDKIFSISSDDEFVKTDINNNNREINFITNNNNINNNLLHNKLSLIDFNNGKIISEINLSLNNNDNIYKKGHFLNNNNVVLIYSKNKLSLIDFRNKENKINNLLPNYNFNFNDVILFDKFQYMTLSPHKISLFDLRYPSLQKTEKVININYKELSVKKNKNKDFSYILFDKFKNDTTFIKLDINQNSLNSPKIFENLAEFQLLNNNNNSQIFIHDIVGFIHQKDDDSEEENENDYNEDRKSLIWEENETSKNNEFEFNNNINLNETYFCFILDNLNGVYMNIYDINNSNEYIENDDDKEEKDIKNYSYYDQIFNMYKEYYKDLPYVPIDEENCIYSNKKDEESEKGFGYVKINEKDKKMFEVASKRKIFEEMMKSYKKNDINPYINLDFLSAKTKERLKEENSRKYSVNSVDSDISANALPIISNEEYETIKDIIDKLNLGKKQNNILDND